MAPSSLSVWSDKECWLIIGTYLLWPGTQHKLQSLANCTKEYIIWSIHGQTIHFFHNILIQKKHMQAFIINWRRAHLLCCCSLSYAMFLFEHKIQFDFKSDLNTSRIIFYGQCMPVMVMGHIRQKLCSYVLIHTDPWISL